MKRNCYFEFAGVSSKDFGNLILAFVQDDGSTYDTGGNFELVTDELPQRSDTLLYGKKYSSSPMEFEIEIISPDDFITSEKMSLLKEWLFGRDGWEKLRLYDTDNFDESCYFYCILKPNQDIFDCGYRGLRCTLISRSPFAYKPERVIYNTNYSDILEASKRRSTAPVTPISRKGFDILPALQTDGTYVYHTLDGSYDKNELYELRAGVSQYFDVYVESADKVIYPKVEIVTTDLKDNNILMFDIYHRPSIYNFSIDHGMVLMNFANNSFARKNLWLAPIKSQKYNEGVDGAEALKRQASIYKRKYIIDCETGIYEIYRWDSGSGWILEKTPLNLNITPSEWNTFGFLKLKNGVNQLCVQGWVESAKISYIPRVRLGAF